MTEKAKSPRGKPLALDPDAISARPTDPAFVSPPKGSPPYYGFPILDDVCVEGFRLGKITDFEAEPDSEGDAFVVAPDHSRAGLVWTVSATSHFREVLAPEPNRWGVWDVSLPHPMTSRENARRNLEHLLPRLRKEWEAWRAQNLSR